MAYAVDIIEGKLALVADLLEQCEKIANDHGFKFEAEFEYEFNDTNADLEYVSQRNLW